MNTKQVLIFAGTTEGRKLAELLGGNSGEAFAGENMVGDLRGRKGPEGAKACASDRKIQVTVSTATEYGKECLGDLEGVEIQTGRLDFRGMEALLREKDIDLVVDATHPFAVEVTKNIRAACAAVGVPCLRCLRERSEYGKEETDDIVCVDSVENAVEYLKTVEGNILITTGSKELWKYTELPGYKERCFARVLSTAAAVSESAALGFEGKHLIAMQGPFSREMNEAVLHQTGADFFVTKESGRAGGFEEKLAAARACGVTLVVIGRPQEDGMSFAEVYESVVKWCG